LIDLYHLIASEGFLQKLASLDLGDRLRAIEWYERAAEA
jgi:hypothetical protein